MATTDLNLILYVVGLATIPLNVHGGACPEMPAPSGAAISFTGQIMEGTTITATCTNGGIMNGPSMLTCTGGQWRPEAFGTCSPNGAMSGMSGMPGMAMSTIPGGGGGMQCLPMLTPPGATLTYGGVSASNTGITGLQNHGTTVSMKCNDNSQVTGSSISVCQNGIWQPPMLGSCMNSGVSGIFPNTNTNMLTPMASGELMCHLGVIPPLNGEVNYSANLPAPAGSTATLTCRPGYTLRGNSVSTCQNGIFGILGTCDKT